MAKPESMKLNSSKLPQKIHPSNDPSEFNPLSYSLEKFRLYETRARFYLIGSDRNKQFFRVLKIDRMEPSDLNISEDPVVYPPEEVKSLLQRIAEGNRATGGLNFVAKVYGIAGCIKFLESHYLVLVKKRRQIGCMCGHAIYSIDESQIIAIPHVSVQTDVAHSKTELRYKKLLSSVDLTKDFFYSYTYPIMRSLQKNVLSTGEDGMPYDNLFVWNSYLTHTIRSRCKNTMWTIALVHGHFKQGICLNGLRCRLITDSPFASPFGRHILYEKIVTEKKYGAKKNRYEKVVTGQMHGATQRYEKIVTRKIHNVKYWNKVPTVCVVCVGCQLGKRCKLPFELRNKIEKEPLLKILYDLWGPTPVESFQHMRYYVIFVDDRTRSTWLYPLKRKSEFYEVFVNSQKMVEKQFTKTIKIFQCDGGGEFNNIDFVKHLDNCGIVRHISCPHTPVQSGGSLKKSTSTGEVLSSTGPPICFEEVLNTTPPICSREVLSSVAPQPIDQSIPIKDDHITAVDTSEDIHLEVDPPQRFNTSDNQEELTLTVEVPATETSNVQTYHMLWPMEEEVDALHQNNTWTLVPKVIGMNIVGSRWVFKIKLKADGSIERHKARLVDKEYSQLEGVDFEEIFSPVVKATTIRIVLSVVISR
ncbi:putative threonylcarbamoyladenosine tRNA methylthiotransferase-like [Capsicum annuum]|nr:putative threonylcarbamoyladenosine tRNA methylthiotransferase-like [Capsicum annuum]